jgi:hypothetical protein
MGTHLEAVHSKIEIELVVNRQAFEPDPGLIQFQSLRACLRHCYLVPRSKLLPSFVASASGLAITMGSVVMVQASLKI